MAADMAALAGDLAAESAGLTAMLARFGATGANVP
jgi:hypothetical protein